VPTEDPRSRDEDLLRARWSPDGLGQYEGEWIAFREGDVRMHHPALAPLLQEFRGGIADGRSPIFAFVTFDVRA
jgi:hypothetical protein